MIKAIKTMAKQEKERYNVPRKVQDVIPVRRIWPDGIFLVGTKFTKTYKFTDINYLVASREDKESMFLTYSELLNSLDSGAVTKITVSPQLKKKSPVLNPSTTVAATVSAVVSAVNTSFRVGKPFPCPLTFFAIAPPKGGGGEQKTFAERQRRALSSPNLTLQAVTGSHRIG